MYQLKSSKGTTISYDRYGSGPPLVLVHGAFSDHITNWEFVRPILERHFTTYAIARPGRGETDAPRCRTIDEEVEQVVRLLESIGEPASLLGHSYGAHVALAAAAAAPQRVRRLVLYEAPWPWVVASDLPEIDGMARGGDWDGFSTTFFTKCLKVPAEDVDALRPTAAWTGILEDAPYSLGDLEVLARLQFDPVRFRNLDVPVQLQIGTESPRGLYVTDALAVCLPNAEIKELDGQAHEGMTTAPDMYAEAVIRFLLDGSVDWSRLVTLANAA